MSVISRGDVVAERFEILSLLGRGGMAEVFLARDRARLAAEPIVLKRILPHLAERPDFARMFGDEARISLRLRHPNIAAVHDVVVHDGIPMLVMEHVDGVSFLDLVIATLRDPVRLDVVIEALWQTCQGLEHAHRLADERGAPLRIVHRDISPQNLLVDRAGCVKIIDFGVAAAAIRSDQTEAGVLKGKYPYMAPERIQGRGEDHRSDIFSVGIVAFELTTRRRLFWRDSDYQTLHAIVTEPVPSMSRVWRGVPTAWDQVVLKALAKNPAERFECAAEMADAMMETARAMGVAPDRGALAALVEATCRGPAAVAGGPARLLGGDQVSKAMSLPVASPEPSSAPRPPPEREDGLQGWQARAQREAGRPGGEAAGGGAGYRLPALPAAPVLGSPPTTLAGCFAYARDVVRMVSARRRAVTALEAEAANLERERGELFLRVGERLRGLAETIDPRAAAALAELEPEAPAGSAPGLAEGQLAVVRARMPGLEAAAAAAPEGEERRAAAAMLVMARTHLAELERTVASRPATAPGEAPRGAGGAAARDRERRLLADLGRGAWQRRLGEERARDLYRGLDRCQEGLEACRLGVRAEQRAMGEFERRPVAVAVLTVAIPLLGAAALLGLLAAGGLLG